MAFTSAITQKSRIIGSPKYPSKRLKRIKGTFTNTSGSTGGDIHPGLRTIKNVLATGNAASADLSAVITSSSSGFTILSAADIDGWWEAEGLE